MHRGQCVYCGEIGRLTQDHAVPRSNGGHGRANMLPACEDCNGAKGKTPLLSWLLRFDAEQLDAVADRIRRAHRGAVLAVGTIPADPIFVALDKALAIRAKPTNPSTDTGDSHE